MRTGTLRRLRSVIAAGGLGLVLIAAGCGGEQPEPSTINGGEDAPAKTSSAGPTPTTTTPPASRSEAPDKEQQLHDATVNFYEVVNEAYRTLDTRPVTALLAPGSKAAAGYVEYIEKVKDKGNRFVDVGEYTVTDFEHQGSPGDERIERVGFTLSHGGGKEVDAQGEIVNEIAPESSEGTIEFFRKGDRWLVLTQQLEEG